MYDSLSVGFPDRYIWFILHVGVISRRMFGVPIVVVDLRII